MIGATTHTGPEWNALAVPSAINAGSLEGIFKPRTIAIVDGGGHETIAQMTEAALASSEFRGTTWVVQRENSLQSQNSYRTLAAIPGKVDLAIVIAPPEGAPDLIEQCVEKNVRGVILLSSGFGTKGTERSQMLERMRAVLAGSRTRVIGPNSLGVLNPIIGLNATLGLPMPLGGTVAFLGESATLSRFVLDWSLKHIVGFSAFACLGTMLNVSWGNMIDYFGSDPYTRTIIMQISSVGDARSLISAAREVALDKPIIVMKTGRDASAIGAVAWNSRCVLSDDDVLAAAFRRVGVLQVDNLEDLFYTADALSKQPRPQGPRLMVVSNADGPAVLAGDMVVRSGVVLAQPSPETRAQVAEMSRGKDQFEDLIGDGSAETYVKLVELAVKDPNCDGLLLLIARSALVDPQRTSELLMEIRTGNSKPMLLSYMGVADAATGQETLVRACIPTFSSPAAAARVFRYMWRYSYDLQALYETPIAHVAGEQFGAQKAIGELLEDVRRAGRKTLSPREVSTVLQAYGINASDHGATEQGGYRAKLASQVDPEFGPVLIFGSADRGKHAYGDAVVALPPLNTTLACRMLEQSKFYAALRSECDPALLKRLHSLLVGFSELIVEQPWIKQFEINPLTIGPDQVVAAGGWCEMCGNELGEGELARPAIRPYPVQYASSWTMKNGEQVMIRPIRADDEPLMIKFHQGLSDRSVYLRYFQHVKLSTRTAHDRLVRVCFLDYDREIALLAEQWNASSQERRVIGVGTLQKLFPKSEGEVAVLVSDDYHGQGLGKELIARLVSFARDERLQVVSATTMIENAGMCAVFKKLGFQLSTDFEEQLVTAKLDLGKSSC
ncbi:MAG TPA: GNAT family N-acetyltransferase [Terriglobales bacterium]|nr:GNAT family N-acetyltransferase [Terriglobales bacterium]